MAKEHSLAEANMLLLLCANDIIRAVIFHTV